MDPKDMAKKMQTLGSNLPPQLAEEKQAATTNIMFDYADIIRGHIRQEIVISPQLKATFQTLNGKEDLWLRKQTGLLTGESVDFVASWYRNAELAIGLCDITLGEQLINLPVVQYEGEEPKADSCTQRMTALLTRVPNVLLNKLQLHYNWFLERIAEEFTGGALKNG